MYTVRASKIVVLVFRLASYGKLVGIRLLDVVTLREKGYRRETKLLGKKLNETFTISLLFFFFVSKYRGYIGLSFFLFPSIQEL